MPHALDSDGLAGSSGRHAGDLPRMFWVQPSRGAEGSWPIDAPPTDLSRTVAMPGPMRTSRHDVKRPRILSRTHRRLRRIDGGTRPRPDPRPGGGRPPIRG